MRLSNTHFTCPGCLVVLGRKNETSVFTSSSWSQKVSLVGYVVRRQLAGFTDGLDVGCDRKDTE